MAGQAGVGEDGGGMHSMEEGEEHLSTIERAEEAL